MVGLLDFGLASLFFLKYHQDGSELMREQMLQSFGVTKKVVLKDIKKGLIHLAFLNT